MKILYILSGFLLLAIGIVGIILPGLPTTPFVLLAAGLFLKSSPRLYNWLLSNKCFNKYITSYNKQKGFTKKQKFVILCFMWLMISLSSFFHYEKLIIFLLVTVAGLIGSIYLLLFVPTEK